MIQLHYGYMWRTVYQSQLELRTREFGYSYNSVTASGEQEAKELEEFRKSIAPSLLAVVDKFPKLFEPPRFRSTYTDLLNITYTSPQMLVPAARRAYRLRRC